jgi:hypothetical protein
MTKSAYDELVERCAKACRKRQIERTSTGRAFDPDVPPTEAELDNARAILAEVERTLETVTPEMIDAWETTPDFGGKIPVYEREWLNMLHASPLFPPDKEQPR